MHAEQVRSVLQSWSFNEHLMALVAAPWRRVNAAARLSRALRARQGSLVRMRARDIVVTIPDDDSPFEFRVPVAAVLSAPGFQHWLIELERSEPGAMFRAAADSTTATTMAWREGSV